MLLLLNKVCIYVYVDCIARNLNSNILIHGALLVVRDSLRPQSVKWASVSPFYNARCSSELGLSDMEAALQDLDVLAGHEQEHKSCIQAGAAKVRKEMDPSCLTLERPHLQCYSPDTLGWAQGRPQRWSEVLEHLAYEERLRQFKMLSLRNGKLKGDLVAITNCLMQG